MDAFISAPLLARVKSWQLVGLGLTGWCTLYSAALVTWGASSTMVGNTQGGCFAATMALAGVEVKKHRKNVPGADPLQWMTGITAEQLNQTIAQASLKQSFRIEPLHHAEMEMGFGVRAVSFGRTLVFETSQWQEPVIGIEQARSTDENRRKVFADIAVIVGRGKPDAEALAFVETHPIQFLIGDDLRAMLASEKPAVKEV